MEELSDEPLLQETYTEIEQTLLTCFTKRHTLGSPLLPLYLGEFMELHR